MAQIDEKSRRNSNGFKVNLNFNPWDCDCYLKPFVEWVKNTKTKIYREVIITA